MYLHYGWIKCQRGSIEYGVSGRDRELASQVKDVGNYTTVGHSDWFRTSCSARGVHDVRQICGREGGETPPTASVTIISSTAAINSMFGDIAVGGCIFSAHFVACDAAGKIARVLMIGVHCIKEEIASRKWAKLNSCTFCTHLCG